MTATLVVSPNVKPGVTDITLSGRFPPPVSTWQLRPTVLNPRSIATARRYGDDPSKTYVEPYDPFIIPLQFASPGQIISIRGALLSCVLESPLPIADGDNRTVVDNVGNIASASFKLPSALVGFWQPGLFKEPLVLGSSGAGVVPVPAPMGISPAGTVYSPAGGFGPTAIYTISGYFTERNFFDREWIISIGGYPVKLNAEGLYILKPQFKNFNPLKATNLDNWAIIKSWSPDLFYNPNIATAKIFDGPVIEGYITGASGITMYKPSEIGSLRFYFRFDVDALVNGAVISTPIFAHMSVKYNQDLGPFRLIQAQSRTIVGSTFVPTWLREALALFS